MPLLLAILFIPIIQIQQVFVKQTGLQAAHEAARYYAINSPTNPDINAVITQSRQVATQNIDPFLNTKPLYYNPNLDVQFSEIDYGPDNTYCRGTVVIHAPVSIPWIGKLLGRPAEAEPAANWDSFNNPMGRNAGSEYVMDIPASGFFKKEVP